MAQNGAAEVKPRLRAQSEAVRPSLKLRARPNITIDRPVAAAAAVAVVAPSGAAPFDSPQMTPASGFFLTPPLGPLGQGEPLTPFTPLTPGMRSSGTPQPAVPNPMDFMRPPNAPPGWTTTPVGIGIGGGAAGLTPRTIGACFLRASHQYAGDPAIFLDDRECSYAEMCAQVCALASRMHALGVRSGDMVGVCVMRCWEQPLALMAIQVCGGIYCPLPPTDPDERIRALISNTKPKLILCQQMLMARLEGLRYAESEPTKAAEVTAAAAAAAAAAAQPQLTFKPIDPDGGDAPMRAPPAILLPMDTSKWDAALCACAQSFLEGGCTSADSAKGCSAASCCAGWIHELVKTPVDQVGYLIHTSGSTGAVRSRSTFTQGSSGGATGREVGLWV
jgi:hypothetical protein